MKQWHKRWKLKRIIASLHYQTSHGLKEQVVEFAKAMDATSMMARGQKKDQEVLLSCKREELDAFITYMVRLHTSKLSLFHRARIALATLAMSSKQVLGESPEEFIKREFPKSKASIEDRRIVVAGHGPGKRKKRRRT